jgi:hypothetical protein
MQTFGFSYDSELNRAVAVFLRYLTGLSPQHQQIWNSKRLDGDFKLHPDYFRASILGEWGEGVSIFEAFIEEQHQINILCSLMGRPPLFRVEFTEGNRPREFGFLLRPTLREFNAFALLLDKMVSDNIHQDFFRDDISLEYEEARPDGKIVVGRKGTIQALDEWLSLRYRIADRTPIDKMIAAFKEIRKLRQQPAHAIKDDEFDQQYLKQQRELMIKAHEAVRTLRIVFSQHPSAQGHKIPEYLDTAKIWDR